MATRMILRRGARARALASAPLILALAWLLGWLAACAPDLPGAGLAPDPAEGEGGSAPVVELDPGAPLDAAPPVIRLRVRVPGVPAEEADLTQIVLVHGKVGPAHLRQIARGEISGALSERIVPSIAWVDEDAPGEAAVVLAPTVALVPGDTYALAVGVAAIAEHLRIATEGAPPVLPRIWPPIDAGATIALGVWCGDDDLPDGTAPAALDPGGPRGEIRRGAVGDLGVRCVRFEATPDGTQPARDPAEGPLVGPPALGDGPPIASLDPRPFVLSGGPPAPAAIPCEPVEVAFGPGCAVVEDDRVHVRSGGAPLLWAVGGAGRDVVVAARPGEPFLIAPLPPLSPFLLDVATVDAAGQVRREAFSAVTLAPRPHVVITEVLANPLGAEPDQEWVELYNDGSVAADLGGYALSDIGGETALPPVLLAPGVHALIVNEAFVEDDELDPPPASGALIVRVPKLGKGGLSNAGEPLRLEDTSGAVVSRAPAAPKPKPGMSLSRVSPRAPDGAAGSFVAGWPTPGRENILAAETP